MIPQHIASACTPSRLWSSAMLGMILAVTLAGCGGSGPSNTLAGTVAVGAPMTDGRVRILDAAGNVVTTDVSVDAQGRYSDVMLTGSGPWRIEACGYAGDSFICLYSFAREAGTANVTPLTSAMAVLATGLATEDLMTGAVAPSAADLATAQATLRQSLAALLAEAGLDASVDLVTGTLSAGSRTGYDRLLDSVGVVLGTDDKPFVQITPRLGAGNLFLQPGETAAGQITTEAQATNLPLQGLETLFSQMTQAMSSASACTAANSGLASLVADDATLSMDADQMLSGAAQVGDALCSLFAGGPGEPSMLGSKLLSPTLGRCDFSGIRPVCAVSFAIQDQLGQVHAINENMSVSYDALTGLWRLRGDLLPINITANGRVQRDRRIDGVTPVLTYSRALAFEIPARTGLACAKVEQSSLTGVPITLALYRRHSDGSPSRLSVWRAGNDGASRSLNPAVGLTRNGDDSWLMLPEGLDGDAAVRNFLRGGRNVTVSLYSDSACSTPFTVAGRSSFVVEVRAVPPTWAALPTIPWATLTDADAAGLKTMAKPAGVSGNYSASWTFTRGRIGIGEAVLCNNRETCGEEGVGRLGQTRLAPRATSATVPFTNGGTDMTALTYKMLALYGNTAEGLGVQSNHMSCPDVGAGLACEH